MDCLEELPSVADSGSADSDFRRYVRWGLQARADSRLAGLGCLEGLRLAAGWRSGDSDFRHYVHLGLQEQADSHLDLVALGSADSHSADSRLADSRSADLDWAARLPVDSADLPELAGQVGLGDSRTAPWEEERPLWRALQLARSRAQVQLGWRGSESRPPDDHHLPVPLLVVESLERAQAAVPSWRRRYD